MADETVGIFGFTELKGHHSNLTKINFESVFQVPTSKLWIIRFKLRYRPTKHALKFKLDAIHRVMY